MVFLAVARSSLARQDIRNCRQLVCLGKWWAAHLCFVRGLDDGDLCFLSQSRSVVATISKGVLRFFAATTLETNRIIRT